MDCTHTVKIFPLCKVAEPPSSSNFNGIGHENACSFVCQAALLIDLYGQCVRDCHYVAAICLSAADDLSESGAWHNRHVIKVNATQHACCVRQARRHVGLLSARAHMARCAYVCGAYVRATAKDGLYSCTRSETSAQSTTSCINCNCLSCQKRLFPLLLVSSLTSTAH